MKAKKIILVILMVQLMGLLDLNAQKVYRVSADGSRDFTTISDAIAAASPGDIIEICGIITNDGIVTDGIVVDKNLTIRGSSCDESYIQASAIQMDEHINKRIFTILEGVTLRLEDLTIQNGYLHHSASSDRGSAIKNHGVLVLKNCVVKQNYAEQDCNVYTGGIFNVGNAVTAFDKWTPENGRMIVSNF